MEQLENALVQTGVIFFMTGLGLLCGGPGFTALYKYLHEATPAVSLKVLELFACVGVGIAGLGVLLVLASSGVRSARERELRKACELERKIHKEVHE